MDSKTYKSMADFAAAILALQKDPKQSEEMIATVNKNYALSEAEMKKYTDSLDVIAEAKKVTSDNAKEKQSILTLTENHLADAKKLASDKDTLLADKESHAKAVRSFQVEKDAHKEALSELASKQTNLDVTAKALEARDKALAKKELDLQERDAISAAREEKINKAKELIG